MKKIISVLLAAMMAVSLFAACGSTSASFASSASLGTASAGTESQQIFKVGILQYVQHTSLDEISAAITAQLTKLAADNNIEIQVDLQNAQGDMSNISTIATQFAGDKVDLIIAIATPAAQGAAAAIEGTGIPLIFSAVTDPVAAELVNSMDAPGGSITGTSDAIPVSNIFDLALQLTPDVKTFGLMYCTSEVNSVTVIEQAKEYLSGAGLAYEEGAVTTAADVQTSAQVLISKVDAVFVPIDNIVATAMSVLAEEAIKAGKPVYVAADSMVQDGGLASVGVNYTNLGTQTADMAYRVLTGADPATTPVEVLNETNIVVNKTTAAAIGVDISKANATTVVE